MEKKNSEQAACNGADQHEVDLADNMDEDAAVKEKLTGDASKVKFTPVSLDGYDGKNGDAKVDLHVAQTTIGMGKEELLKYANEPYWVRLRMSLFVLFWVIWVGMLVGSIVIIILAPRCPPAPKLEWYQKSAMYQVDVKTFKDSDGNGIGDIKGLISKLDYFKEQNIDALMLSSFYQSSSDGIVDHKKIDSSLGSMEDFTNLVQQLKEKDIRLVIDFNPNHSSDQHPWFTNSVEGQEPYKDFYVWADASKGPAGGPPNNWLNTNGDSAWKWNEQRQQYYLHTFGEKMPDLNLRNELVKEELRDIVNFWMAKDVDGFKVVAASHLIEDKDLRDEPVASFGTPNKRQYADVNHIYTVDQPENLGLFAEWKQLLKNFTAFTGIPKILMPQLSGSMNTSVLYYGNDTVPLTELPYNIHFTELNEKSTGKDLQYQLNRWMNHNIPSYGWPTVLVGSENVPRLASRVGEDLVDAIHMVAVFTKGTPITYYADELGVTDSSNDKTNLKQTVMLWSNETYSGFTNGSTSLHVHPKYETLNVMAQEKNKQSHLKIFSRLLALRGQPALNFGLQEYPLVTDEVFSLMRVRKGSPGYLVVLNLGMNSTVIDFTGKSGYLPEMARVEIRSSNIISGILSEGDHPKIALKQVRLDPKQAVVFSFVPIFES